MSTMETAKAPQAAQQSGLLLDVKDLRHLWYSRW